MILIMRGQLGPLNRILSLKRQSARLADAACLAARRTLEQLENDVHNISHRIEELNRQFLNASPTTDSITSLRAFYNTVGHLNDERRRIVADAQRARQSFQEAARKCMQIHREADTLDRVLAARREQILREIDRREMERLDELILQRQQRRPAAPAIPEGRGGITSVGEAASEVRLRNGS